MDTLCWIHDNHLPWPGDLKSTAPIQAAHGTKWFLLVESSKVHLVYPLVNGYITMEHPHFIAGKTRLFLLPFSIAILNMLVNTSGYEIHQMIEF